MPRYTLKLGLVALLAFVSGCGGGGPELVPVSGTITVNGEPLANATIIFQPLGQEMPDVQSGGQTDAEGRFELVETQSRRPGAVIGKHKVTITPPLKVVDDPADEMGVDPDDESDYEVIDLGNTGATNLGPRTTEYTVPPEGTSVANIDIE